MKVVGSVCIMKLGRNMTNITPMFLHFRWRTASTNTVLLFQSHVRGTGALGNLGSRYCATLQAVQGERRKSELTTSHENSGWTCVLGLLILGGVKGWIMCTVLISPVSRPSECYGKFSSRSEFFVLEWKKLHSRLQLPSKSSCESPLAFPEFFNFRELHRLI